jgi:putative membrane protein
MGFNITSRYPLALPSRQKGPLSLRLSRLATILIVAWTLSMIAVPIVKWTRGVEAIYPLLSITVLLQAGAVFSILYPALGVRRTAGIAAAIMLFTLAAEAIGARTGFPFGPYHYTERLQPQVGPVPLLIPLAWFMMVPSAWAVAQRFRRKRWQFIPVSALALVAWDLLLDPQMVHWDLWQWDNPGLYFGIPLTNFAGWFLVGVLLTWLIPAPAQRLPVRPLLLVYTITWFLEAFGLAFFWGMPGPAVAGGLVMGFFVWFGWRSTLGQPQPAGEIA